MENYLRSDEVTSDHLFKKAKAKRAAKKASGKKGLISRAIGSKKSRTIVKKKIAAAPKKVAAAVGKVAANAIMLPLFPFMPHMKKELQAKGFDTKKMDIPTTTVKFYNEVVSKKGNAKSSLEPIDEAQYYELPQFKMSWEQWEQQDNIVDDLLVIVNKIIEFFKRARNTMETVKQSGENIKSAMTDTEVRAAYATDTVLDELDTRERMNQPIRRGDLRPGGGFRSQHVVGGVGALLIIILIIWAISKK